MQPSLDDVCSTHARGVGLLESPGDTEIFNVTSDVCPTYIALRGNPVNDMTLRYEPVDPVSDCTEANAVDMGVPGTAVNVANDGCLKITQYPFWWGTRQMQLQNMTGSAYPVPFDWSNPCGVSEWSNTITGDWQSIIINNISDACTTLIDLNGAGDGNLTIRYYAM